MAESSNYQDALSLYLKAQRAGIRTARAAQAAGKKPYLTALEDIVPNLNQLARVDAGIRTIAIDRIAGTVSTGRSPSFSADFHPLLDQDTEFCHKWVSLCASVMEEGMRDPIKVYEYMHRYYALEGNKRVSVLKMLEAMDMEADITRVMPKKTGDKQVRVYYECLAFEEKSGIHDLVFTEEGCYDELCGLLGVQPGEKWSERLTMDFRADFRRFCEVLRREIPEYANAEHATEGDAFLLYLRVFGYSAKTMEEKEVRTGLGKLRKELLTWEKPEPVTLKLTPDGEEPGLLAKLIDPGPNRIKACFIANRAPEVSGWAYWHKLGMLHVEIVFSGRIQTQMISNVAAEDCEAAIDRAVQEGANVVFTTSPLLLPGAMKAAIRHPGVKILNCSLLPGYSTVRSYYLRMYEAKFIMGALAGIVSEGDVIGYIADYPVYGVPASVNAFALGAQMTNPKARVRLKWSALQGCDPEAELLAEGVQVICNRDIAAPAYESTAFGLYMNCGGTIQNLMMPMWEWGSMYEDLLRRIMSGMWKTDVEDGQQALNYWWGMDSGAVDVIHSRRLPAGAQRLVALLRGAVAAGTLKPFAGEIISQDGRQRCRAGETMTPARILAMDWLCANVEGSFPEPEALKPYARDFVRMQGIRTSRAPQESQINVDDK